MLIWDLKTTILFQNLKKGWTDKTLVFSSGKANSMEIIAIRERIDEAKEYFRENQTNYEELDAIIKILLQSIIDENEENQ